MKIRLESLWPLGVFLLLLLYGAVDLQWTAATAANLCLDVLLGTVTTSCRRTWQGDLTKLAALGGTPAVSFDRSNSETSWPWDTPIGGSAP